MPQAGVVGLLGRVFSRSPAQLTTVDALSLTSPQRQPRLSPRHRWPSESAARPCRGSGSQGRRSRAPYSSTTRRAESSSYPPPAPSPPPGAFLNPKPSLSVSHLSSHPLLDVLKPETGCSRCCFGYVRR
jgi:hypothetical protein